MDDKFGLERFVAAQQRDYPIANAELSAGKKRSHWMWYIFPQVSGLGFSETSKYYAINSLDEAAAFLAHPLLGERLIALCKVLLQSTGASARQIFGTPDDLKLKSCMTLFAALPKAHPVFKQVLQQYFEGARDDRTIEILGLAKDKRVGIHDI